MFPDNIIVGEPLVDIKKLGIKKSEFTVKTNEIFLPKILKEFGIFSSTSQVKKNRPDLWRELKPFEMIKLKIGFKRIWIIKGKLKKN